jgi:hypothetical protein
VYWTMMDSVDLDSKVVERFDGKVMAIVGFEADQVRLCKLEHGQNCYGKRKGHIEFCILKRLCHQMDIFLNAF